MINPPREDAAPLRRVVLCADDFAQSLATIEGILALVDAQRLSAVSCLVESPLWADAGVRLRSRPSTFDIGLHFNLTHDFAGKGHRPMALPLTALAACLRIMDPDPIERSLQRQLDLFEEVMARPPDFIDGHQHVHQLPVVRNALISVLRSRGWASSTAIRVTVPSRFRGLKGWLIARLGGRELLKTVRQEGISHNTDFAGIYDFSASLEYGERLSHWLADICDGGLIVCHPARAEAASGDPIARARARELAHLASAAYLPLLHQRRVWLARFRDLSPPK